MHEADSNVFSLFTARSLYLRHTPLKQSRRRIQYGSFFMRKGFQSFLVQKMIRSNFVKKSCIDFTWSRLLTYVGIIQLFKTLACTEPCSLQFFLLISISLHSCFFFSLFNFVHFVIKYLLNSFFLPFSFWFSFFFLVSPSKLLSLHRCIPLTFLLPILLTILSTMRCVDEDLRQRGVR